MLGVSHPGAVERRSALTKRYHRLRRHAKAEAPPGMELLSPRDIVERLKETRPRRPEGKPAHVARINAGTTADWPPSNRASARNRGAAVDRDVTLLNSTTRRLTDVGTVGAPGRSTFPS